MNQCYGVLCLIFLSAEASLNGTPMLPRTSAPPKTDVVSLTFCESSLPAVDKMGKKTLEEVHTYAELKHDPRSSLPESFTVCSTIMTTGCQSYLLPTFVNILDNQNDQLLAPIISHGDIESRLNIGFQQRN